MAVQTTTRTIDVNELRTMLEGHRPVTVLDVRKGEDRAEWAIPGSMHTDAYEVPDRIREQVILRDRRRNLGSHATPWWVADLISISSSFSAGVWKPCRLRGRELSSAAMLSSSPGP